MILLLALACSLDEPTVTDTGSVAGVADHSVTEAHVGALDADQALWAGAEFTVEPGQDVMMCLFGTYTGETIGLHDVHTFQGAGGHHLQIMGTSTPAIDVADGTIADCTGVGGVFNMADLEPIGVTNGGEVDGVEIDVSMPLPEGMAVKLESGQRYVMQSHYFNTTLEAFKVRDLAVLTLLPAADIPDELWAAPLVFNDSNFSIPVGSELTRTFDCTTEKDWNFLYVLGHMHEWGTAISIEEVELEGTVKPFYEIAEWEPVYRDAPVIDYYPDGAMPVPAGTTYRTSCSWFNDQDTPLVFPYEMCVGLSIVYPQKATVVCDAE